jgi:hypothetical protein
MINAVLLALDLIAKVYSGIGWLLGSWCLETEVVTSTRSSGSVPHWRSKCAMVNTAAPCGELSLKNRPVTQEVSFYKALEKGHCSQFKPFLNGLHGD